MAAPAEFPTATQRRLQEARGLDAQGRQGNALFAYRMLLRLDPHCLDAKVELAGLLSCLGRHSEARDLCQEVLMETPAHRAACLNLGGALMGLGEFIQADDCYKYLLKNEPTMALALLGLGTSQVCQGRLLEARATLGEALDQAPGNPQGQATLLRVLIQLKAWPAAQALWSEMAQGRPTPFERNLEQAVVYLLFADFERGWALMEGRLDQPGFVTPTRAYPQPRWDGAPFPGKTLLLHWEQGFGDTIMFIRYASLAKARGGRVLALVPALLLSLAQTVAGLDAVLSPEDPLPPFDLQVSLFSLPQVFATRLDSVPATIPYLSAPAPAAPALEAALAGSSDPRLGLAGSSGPRLGLAGSSGLRVGLAWAGSPANRNDALRTIPLKDLACLEQVAGVSWFSLQVGYEGGLPFAGIRDLAPLLPDFAATAQAMERLDLIITVDTAVAHLAGALGRPTWLLLPFIPEWRWLLERENSPWYPSFRLFRQENPGSWQELLDRVVAALLERLRGTC